MLCRAHADPARAVRTVPVPIWPRALRWPRMGLSHEFMWFKLLLLLLLLSALPFSQGWLQRIIILHIFLSSTSVSFAPTFPISSFTTSKNLLFSLPLLLYSGNSISIIFLPTYSWSLLMTCPYHLSLPSLIFIPNHSTLTVLLM